MVSFDIFRILCFAMHGRCVHNINYLKYLQIIMHLTNKPVQPNFRGTDFWGSPDILCIRPVQLLISFLPIGSHPWKLHRPKAELTGVLLIRATSLLGMVVRFNFVTEHWIKPDKNFGGKISSAEIRLYRLNYVKWISWGLHLGCVAALMCTLPNS